MAKLDRILLIAAYVLLGAVVIFLSWEVDRQLRETRESICTVAWIQNDNSQVQTVITEGLFAALANTLTENDQERTELFEQLIQDLQRFQTQSDEILTDICGPSPLATE